MGNRTKGSGLYLVKRGSFEITSCSVDMRTNLIPSNGLTRAEGEKVSVGFDGF